MTISRQYAFTWIEPRKDVLGELSKQFLYVLHATTHAMFVGHYGPRDHQGNLVELLFTQCAPLFGEFMVWSIYAFQPPLDKIWKYDEIEVK